jgi:GNAT superfamily N-acetyltransferase
LPSPDQDVNDGCPLLGIGSPSRVRQKWLTGSGVAVDTVGPMAVSIEEYAGSHRDLEWSFREAEDSEPLLASYIDLGRLWVARTANGEAVGHLQAVPREGGLWEVTNTAVAEARRGLGIGRALLERALDEARSAGVGRVILATATADVGNLRFYQRCGFRMTHVVPDAFDEHHGYPPGIVVDGIPMQDQVWFERVL